MVIHLLNYSILQLNGEMTNGHLYLFKPTHSLRGVAINLIAGIPTLPRIKDGGGAPATRVLNSVNIAMETIDLKGNAPGGEQRIARC